MKILSYSLFRGKINYDHRFWDENKNEIDRYWVNIPSLILANQILYPDFLTKIFISKNLENHFLIGFLKKLRENFNFDFKIVDEEYHSHEAALWRLKPLWEDSTQLLLSRDIDSLPNYEEYCCFKFFEKSDCSVNTIRSHVNHFNYPCRMLIGLSGFKPQIIDKDIKKPSYDEFVDSYSPKTGKWDDDQISVIKAFTDNNQVFSLFNFLDCRINDQDNVPDFSCESIEEKDVVGIPLTDQQEMYFDILDDYEYAKWAGQPCDSRGEFLKNLIDITKKYDILNMMNKNDKKFYNL